MGSSSHDPDDKKKGFIGARAGEAKLTSFGPSRAKTNEQFLANLAMHGASAGPKSTETPEGDSRSTMVGWFDHLFDAFAQWEYDYNLSVERPELRLLMERPERVSSAPQGPAAGQRMVLKGRMSLQGWSMFVRATPDLVESYVMPSDRAISFTVNPGQFNRLIQISVGQLNGNFGWFLGERPIDWDEIPELARQLMEALKQIASGATEVDRDFAFLSESHVVVSGPVPAPMVSPPPVPQRQHSAILGGLDSPARAAQPPGYTHPSILPPPGQSPHPAVLPPPGQSRPVSTSIQPPAQPAPPISTSIQPPAQPALSYGDAPQVELLKPTFPAPAVEPSLNEAFDQVIAALDRDLKKLSADGARAFAEQDTEGAERGLHRASRLKMMRADMVATFLRWKSMLSD